MDSSDEATILKDWRGKAPAQVKPCRNCRCGRCIRCIDEARWDRIFAEKFADPDYYRGRPVSQGSSLGWLK
jgi:hypothetical protein